MNDQCLQGQRSDSSLRCPLGEFLDKNALFSVLRVKHDFGASNNVGFFGTARIFPQNRNFTGGFDGTYKVDKATVMTFQAVGTYSKKNFYDPDSDSTRYRAGSGFGYYWSLDHTKDTHGYFAEIFGRSDDYRADAGFTKRTNSNQGFFAYRVSTKSKPKSTLIRLNSNQFVRYTFDFNGRPQYGLIGANFNAQLQGSLFVNFEAGDQFEKDYEEEFGAKRNPMTGQAGAFFGASTRYARQPYFSFNINKIVNKQFNFYGFIGSVIGAVDYDFGAGPRYPRVSPAYLAWVAASRVGPEPALDPGPGRQLDIEAGFEYKPINPLRITLDYTKSKLTRNDNELVAFNTNIFTLRSTYQFTRFAFVRARWDYDTLRANAAGEMLFGWNPNPGTAFYVGYNDDFNYNGFNPFTGRYEPGFARNSRTFFIRASYLFRKSF
jgi:hypothetical protein